MAPILYMLRASPPVRAVLMTALELNVELELKECNILENQQFQQEFIEMNPAHTIPTLVDSGLVIFESAAIMGYLVNKYGKNDNLYPQDIGKRAVVDQLLHFSTSSYVLLLDVMKPVITFRKKKATIPEDRKCILFERIEILEKLISGKNYVAGNDLTIADYSLIAWISTLDFAFPLSALKFPNILAWWKRLAENPGYEANREGLFCCSMIWASRD